MAQGDYSHAEGRLTEATGEYSRASGFKTEAVGSASIAEGVGALAQGDGSYARGMVQEFPAVAIGQGSEAIGVYSIATNPLSKTRGAMVVDLSIDDEGQVSTTPSDNELCIANSAEGVYVASAGLASHAEGAGLTMGIGIASHAEGLGTSAIGPLVSSVMAGNHSEGVSTLAYGGGSHAEGVGALVEGDLDKSGYAIDLANSTVSRLVLSNSVEYLEPGLHFALMSAMDNVLTPNV